MSRVGQLFEQYEDYVVAREDDDTTAIEAAAVLWHPDDEIILSIALAEAGLYNVRIHGITLSRGEATTKNYRQHEGFEPALGHRVLEAVSGAGALEFASHTQLEAPDGQPKCDLDRYANQVADILMSRNVDLVLSTTRMSPYDSLDHLAAGVVAFMAAEKATKGFGQHMGVMIVQPGKRGEYVAEQYERSLDVVRRVSLANRSQFRVETIAAQPDWIPLTGGFAMHPDDWKELKRSQYPLEGIATHTYAKCGQLLVPQLVAT